MAVCVVIQNKGSTATGSDVTPNAIAFSDVVSYINSGVTNTVTVTGIDTPIVLRMAWTTVGDANQGRWLVNGVPQPFGASPQDVTVNLNNTIAFGWQITADAPASTSGVATLTNRSDSNATLDTLNYFIERPEHGGFS